MNDFADEHKLVDYIGIVLRVSDPNETVTHGRITNLGPGKVIIATARKFLGTIYNTLKNG